MVDAAAGHELLTFMDASSRFQQIQMEPYDQEDTTFMTPTGIYCYIAMPFGLRNAGATYQRLVNMMFKDQLGDTMEVYIDDMVVKSKRKEHHLQDLEVAFNILDRYNMKLNPSKCHFGVKAGIFLGYVVTKSGIEASPEQIKAIINLKSPRNVKDIHRLTRGVVALNRFISKSSEKCKEFYDILRKNKKFEGTEKHETALKDLKDYISSAPALMKPVNGESLILYLAVSGNAVSAVLVKDHEGQQHPVYYVSKSLLDAEARYSHLEKLILALIMPSTKLRHYFETHTIVVKTNYPIKNVLRKPELSGRVAKWAVKLSTYDIKYEPRNAIKSQALADFVADFTSDLQVQAYLEVQQLEETKDPWILYTDGASNVRGTSLGILLKLPQGDIIPQSIAYVFQATNNEAEYEALVAGSQLAQHMKIRYLQVPREENAWADSLVNLVSSLKIPEDLKIPIIHILHPTIDDRRIMEINSGNQRMDPSSSQAQQGSWIQPISKYIEEGEIPIGEKPKSFRFKNRILLAHNEKRRHELLKCDACQRHSNILHQPAEPLYLIVSSWPFMKWDMDIVGKLPKAPGGKVFMLAMTDYFSKWIEAESFAQVKEKKLGSKKGKWAEELPYVLWADRTTPKNATGQTPFSLVFGAEAVIPTEMVIPTARTSIRDVTPRPRGWAVKIEYPTKHSRNYVCIDSGP
ncbi:hypothetical protein QVD17_08256 [Tagetes erecta]|uniref:Reverse transcriptase domain-containing protein n=1 Tax=Tagetes erecta TaxID=13708 RepID=A0AAD8NXI7_TARER|nr:hypothetical protein QVD17_08256 [Tagetes erecta]